MDKSDLFISRMEDLAARAAKVGCAASRFLTPAEAAAVTAHFAGRRSAALARDVTLTLDGGYDGAERVRAIFTNADWGSFERGELLTALKIEHRPQDTLQHRDILGALMALGIERDTIGDIAADTSPQTLICLPEHRAYIIEHVTKIGSTGVAISEIALDELSERDEELRIITDTVASTRLDAVLSAAFNLSRSKAAELIASGRVNVGYMECAQPAKELREGELISVRGLGRARLVEIGGQSRKGRLFVRIGLFER